MFHFGFSKRRRERITAPPNKVSVLTPTNGAIHRQLDLVITWDRPSMAQSYDVYIGATADTLSLVSDGQLARVYAPTLALDSTYYFRVDSVNSLGTTTGDVLSFSTWSINDILTDGDGIPVTDGNGEYIETITA